MSLLTIIQRASRALGLPPPSAVVSSSDALVQELLELSNIDGQELVTRYEWQQITKEALFTSTAAFFQGLFNSTLVPTGDFDHIINNTMWNRSQGLKVSGPITGAEWQQDQAYMIVAPNPKMRIWQGALYIGPSVPAAGDTFAFEYISTNWCQGASGTAQPLWVADSDTGILDESLIKMGVIWRYKAAKGLEYAEDLTNYENEFQRLTGQSTGARALYLGGANVVFPVNVPEGNWPT